MTIERAHPLITKRAVINIEWDVKRLRFTGHTKDTKYYCGANDEDFFQIRPMSTDIIQELSRCKRHEDFNLNRIKKRLYIIFINYNTNMSKTKKENPAISLLYKLY